MRRDNLNRLYDSFKEQAELISARVYRAADVAGAGRQLSKILNDLNVSKVVAADSKLVHDCLQLTTDGNVEVYTRDINKHAADAALGLSEVDLAIAETGTLAQDSTALEKRLVSTLPPVHVALVYTERLVEKFEEGVQVFNQKRDRLPGYIAFISGPSRTADIERVLTIGVHGPEQLHIIFVDQAGGEPDES